MNVSLISQTFKKIGTFVGSLKNVAVQTYRLAPVRLKDAKTKTRTEREMIRVNNEALIPVCFLGLSQFVPIFGNVFVLAALAWPRQIQAEAFFNAEELRRVRLEEHAEKLTARILVEEALSSASQPYSAAHFERTGRFHVPALIDAQYLQALCMSNALFASHAIYRIAPSFLLKSRLNKRAREVAEDDELLRAAAASPVSPAGPASSGSSALSSRDPLEDLSHEELASACTRRGADPTLSRDECLTYLRQWLTLKSAQAGGGAADEASRHSRLVHVLALGLPSRFE